MRRCELCAALVERLALQLRDQRYEAPDRIFGALRIGAMPLFAADNQMAVERAATADLDGVAPRLPIARLAQDAMIEFLAALCGPFQQPGGAIDRDAFFIAGDQKRDRALRLAAIRGKMIEDGRDCAGDAAFHVDGAASVYLAAGNLAGKWRMLPGFLITRRHHVRVA